MISLSRVMRHIAHEEERLFGTFGLTRAQFAVLEVLRNKGQLTQKQIRELILMTPGNLPVVIRNLIRSGLVTQLSDPSDGRCKRIALTESGEQLIDAVLPRNAELLHRHFSVWTPEEKRRLFKLLGKYRREQEDGSKDFTAN